MPHSSDLVQISMVMLGCKDPGRLDQSTQAVPADAASSTWDPTDSLRVGSLEGSDRAGNCLDNAVIENFFGLLKSELLYLQEFPIHGTPNQELIEYLDYYNNRRIKAKLKGLPPAISRTASPFPAA